MRSAKPPIIAAGVCLVIFALVALFWAYFRPVMLAPEPSTACCNGAANTGPDSVLKRDESEASSAPELNSPLDANTEPGENSTMRMIRVRDGGGEPVQVELSIGITTDAIPETERNLFAPSRASGPNGTTNTLVISELAVGRSYAVTIHVRARAESMKVFNKVRPTFDEPVVNLDATDIDLSD